MKEEKATVEAADDLGAGYYLLHLHAEHIARQVKPGQFVMVRPHTGFDPLLRRPLGILQCRDSRISLYFQVKGRGTALLASQKTGDSLDLLGPLGKAFPEFAGQRILLVAGGRGIVPLFFFASIHAPANTMVLAYGGKCREEIHLLDLISQLRLAKVYLYSEDGSLGRKGKVTDELAAIIAAECIQVTVSCGPEGMLQAVRENIGKSGTANYFSLESLMGCGFGICHSCAVPAANGGYLKVCEDGPLFRMEDLKWPI